MNENSWCGEEMYLGCQKSKTNERKVHGRREKKLLNKFQVRVERIGWQNKTMSEIRWFMMNRDELW